MSEICLFEMSEICLFEMSEICCKNFKIIQNLTHSKFIQITSFTSQLSEHSLWVERSEIHFLNWLRPIFSNDWNMCFEMTETSILKWVK